MLCKFFVMLTLVIGAGLVCEGYRQSYYDWLVYHPNGFSLLKWEHWKSLSREFAPVTYILAGTLILVWNWNHFYIPTVPVSGEPPEQE